MQLKTEKLLVHHKMYVQNKGQHTLYPIQFGQPENTYRDVPDQVVATI